MNALAVAEALGHRVTVINYLQEKPDRAALEAIVAKLPIRYRPTHQALAA